MSETPALDWDAAWRERRTPWELWGPTPALEALVASGALRDLGLPEGARAAVPGCGRGHDLRVLARQGLEVTGFDIVPEAVAEARHLLALNGDRGTVLCRDVLGLLPEYAGTFELVYDYTCFCALRPHLRPAYAKVVQGLLRPGGWLLALMFPMAETHAGRGRPPYLVTPAVAETVFTPLVLEDSAVPDVPGDPRAGAQRWYVWRKNCSP
ncbi:MAG: methyltransferase domain-containing protein [Planctomycetota bacterium]